MVKGVKITPIFAKITHQSKSKKNDPIETKMPFFFFLSNTYNLSFHFPPSFFLPRQLSFSLCFIVDSVLIFLFGRWLHAHSLSFLAENKFNFLPLFHLFFILGHENMKKCKQPTISFLYYHFISFCFLKIQNPTSTL